MLTYPFKYLQMITYEQTGKKQYGFSINELIIVIGIIVVLFGVVYVYYNNFISLKQLESQSSKLARVLEIAQKSAVAGDLSTICTGDYLGHRVIITTTSYNLRSHCSSSDGYVINNALFANGITSIIEQGAQTINFQAITGKADPTCIRLLRPDVSSSRCIRITAAGSINEGACSSCSSFP